MDVPILVVEDDDDIRRSLVDLIEDEAFQVRAAANGREALTLLRSGLRPSLILLDLMMPVMDGWEFAEAVADDLRMAEIPIYVMTAMSSIEIAPRRTVGVLPKPLDIVYLLSIIRRHAVPRQS